MSAEIVKLQQPLTPFIHKMEGDGGDYPGNGSQNSAQKGKSISHYGEHLTRVIGVLPCSLFREESNLIRAK
jgi:hypothetical protein